MSGVRASTHPVRGIDHVFLLVRELDSAAARWRRLGFTLSPKGLHSTHKGTANHTIMLDGDYVELLGVVNPTPANATQRAALARGEEGLAAVACKIDDAREAVAALGALGIPTTDVMDFERPVALPAGGSGRAAFSIAAFAPDAVPHGHVFMCQHHTRDSVWLPELVRHPNGARRLAGLVARVDDPEEIAGAYARLFGEGVVHELAAGAEVRTGDAPITFLRDEAWRTAYPGLAPPRSAYGALRLAVDDVDAARHVVAAGGAAIHPTAQGFAVAPEDAAGAVVEFVPA